MAKDTFDVCFSVLDASGRMGGKSSRPFANHKSGFVGFAQWVVNWQTPGVEQCFTMGGILREPGTCTSKTGNTGQEVSAKPGL